jgi:natural product biosynthesis luciferase-like monooxygenase protein
MNRVLDCLLVGDQSLLVRCGDRLRAAGWRIAQVVTGDEGVARWAAGLELPCESYSVALAERLGPGAVDYVFSIGNLRMLPSSWLAVARRRTINFHDGPLPEYRGLHVTAWALLNREAAHGITWHEARPKVDAGDVLEEERFPIAADDTALTLNAKCYDAGSRAFDRLITALATGSVTPRPIDVAAGRYFPRNRRPAGAGYLDWRRPPDDCEALVRALDFGPYPNPLCTPWFMRQGHIARADHATVARMRGGGVAGLEPVADALLDRLGVQHEAWCDREAGWVARCSSLQPLPWPLSAPADGAAPQSVTADLADLAPHGANRLVAALVVWLAREFDTTAFDLGYRSAELGRLVAGLEPWFETLPPLAVAVDLDRPVAECVAAVESAMVEHAAAGSFLRDLVHRYPALTAYAATGIAQRLGVGLVVGGRDGNRRDDGAPLVIYIAPDGTGWEWRFDAAHLAAATVEAWQQRSLTFLRAALAAPARPASRVDVLSDSDRLSLEALNATARPIDGSPVVHRQFEHQVERTPDAVAACTWTTQLTYRALNQRANRLARWLQGHGVAPGDRVGLHLERSVDLVAAVLAVLKTGAAYVPLDPALPLERCTFMVADARLKAVITEAAVVERLPSGDATVLVLDRAAAEIDAHPADDLPASAEGSDPAYVIYTSGSTGTPKGVTLEHRNVTSFFAAMDTRIAPDPAGVWLAVTSLSFDISVLELLWTLCRGFTVVIQRHPQALASRGAVGRSLNLSLFYFASDAGRGGPGQYRLLLEGARFADAHGFEAVWTPERHFHAFGGPYPNPAITSAAVAAITSKVRIRAGSLVMPLHHPVRAAEDWSLVDNLSNGRVDIAFASGWHPNDFVFAPHLFDTAKQAMLDGLQTVRRLWRGETLALPGPGGREIPVATLPRPVQPELPVWITAAGNVETFRMAGTLGANVLTHLLGQTADEVATKIQQYREARRAAGHHGEGHVTLMLHTFVGNDDGEVRDIVRAPMKQYLATSLNLVKPFAWAFPAFKSRPDAPGKSTDELFRDLSPADLDALLDFAFDRYFETGGLFGSVATCIAQVERLRAIGVDEIACLVDFGVPVDLALAGFEKLAELRTIVARPSEIEPGLADTVARFAVTHFQCTPSMAAMLTDDPGAMAAASRLRHWLVGGEALPAALADRLAAAGPRVTNMYGPTETTVWSLTHDVRPGESPVPIGRPIDNTRLYVLDSRGEQVPIGVEGELYIGGPGVARGYWERPELTAERFVADRFTASPGARLYRTGDRVTLRPDGVVEFRGRADQQVKLRGHRVELGEVEAALRRVDGVRDAAVVIREDAAGDQRLVGYVTARGDSHDLAQRCRDAAKAWLPEVMVPSVVMVLAAMPLTPNGKVDRRALPATASVLPQGRPAAPPEDDLQRRVAEIWKAVLRTDTVGVDDNFFDLGGHSLLVVQMAGRLGDELGRPLPITDVFRFPTIRRLAGHLSGRHPATADGARAGEDRAAARRAARSRRHDR